MRSVAVLLLLTACARPTPSQRDPSRADLELTHVRMKTWANGTLNAVTTADHVEVFREAGTPGDVVAHDAGVLLVKDQTHITAPLVHGNFLNGQLEATGGVTMTRPGDVRATSPTVYFDRGAGNGGTAASDAGLHFHRPGLEVESEGFFVDVGDEHASFDGITSTFSQ